MAVLIMANDEGKPIFHDFFGVSCTESPAVLAKAGLGEVRLSEASPSASVGASSGAHGPVSASSDVGSERQGGNIVEGVRFHGPKSDFSVAEINNRYSGRKRSNSDSAFMGSPRDRMLQIVPESRGSSQLAKMFQNEAGSERPRRPHEDELFFGMQPPRPTSASIIPQPPLSSWHDLFMSNWDRSMPLNPRPVLHYPPRVGEQIACGDKHASSRNRDSSASTSLISQPAADEGSRTGNKGAGILKIINASSVVSEKHPTALMTSNRPVTGSHNIEAETPNQSRYHGLTSTSRQMTIFYAGQAHVFDDVHPNKADAIMAMAGSNGGSWSTTYSPKSNLRPAETSMPAVGGDVGNKIIAFPEEARATSNHIFNQSPRISISEPVGHVGRPLREARTVAQAAGPDTQGKKDV